MPSKLAQSEMDGKRDLQKQLGCMNGIFQLFDRRYFLGQQRVGVRNHKRLPPPTGQSGNKEMELKDAPEKAMEKDPKKFAKEKQRVSVESSRTSFSSTCSSTEPPSSSKSIFPDASPSPKVTIEQPTHRKPLNLRDLVKDSMYREPRYVSVKTAPNEEGVNRTMKHIDSPRPIQHQKSVQPRAYGQEKSNRNISWNYNEEKDAPRFSYDGRVSQNKLKSSVKLKEVPRLSLDSRESRKIFLKDSKRSEAFDQEPGSNKRPSGLVAKLMGLEPLPDLRTDNDLETTLASSRTGEEVKKSQLSGSPRVSYNESASPRMAVATKQHQKVNSRLPLEPAPWRQEGDRRGTQKAAPKTKESPTMSPHPSPSVYGEIEKRLTELEFKKSGKDLRALKQILEAMEKTRKRLEDPEQHLDVESKSSKCSSDYGRWDEHSQPVSPPVPKRGQFPITVIKPAKFIGKPIVETSGLKKLRTKRIADKGFNHVGDPSGKPPPSPQKTTNSKTLRPSLSPKMTENISGERLISSSRNSKSGSPRMQQKRQGTEKQSSPSDQSDYNRERRQSIRKSIRSEGPTKTMKPKATNSQHNDERSGGLNLSQQSDTVSMQSETNSSLASQNDIEVTSREWTCKINMHQSNDYNTKNCAARLREDGSMAELATTTTTMEQPSPVSVLDAAFYGEESPSPVKKISNAFRDYETLASDEAEWSTNGWSKFNHDKLENIRQLVDRITLLNSRPKESTTNVTALICENMHPDHRYITEIFIASGFLENLGSSTAPIPLHSSGHLLDPNLFHVLEKSKDYTELGNYEYQEKCVGSKSSERNRRKLIFDSVDEILDRKLAFTISNKARRNLSGEKLLEEVWSEINNLQANSENMMDDEDDELISIIRADVNKKLADWDGHSNEVPGLVLDIERLIFKDLINEVVSDGVAGILDQSVRHCKKLFSM